VNLFAQAADGSGDVTQLTNSPSVQHATSVWPDGTRLVFTETAPATGQDVMQLRLDSTHSVTPLVQTPFNERNGPLKPLQRFLPTSSTPLTLASVASPGRPPRGYSGMTRS
jgi:Tol biopolymer transport system component